MRNLRSRILGYGLTAVLLVGLATACQATKASGTTDDPPGETITLEGVQSVLGKGQDMASGVVDISQADNELVIAYQYYDVDLENYQTDFATELAPRIQALYKKFKTLDRVHFQVTANSTTAEGEWKPFTEFVLDRKTVEEIHWTGFLVRYLLETVLKHRLP